MCIAATLLAAALRSWQKMNKARRDPPSLERRMLLDDALALRCDRRGAPEISARHPEPGRHKRESLILHPIRYLMPQIAALVSGRRGSRPVSARGWCPRPPGSRHRCCATPHTVVHAMRRSAASPGHLCSPRTSPFKGGNIRSNGNVTVGECATERLSMLMTRCSARAHTG